MPSGCLALIIKYVYLRESLLILANIALRHTKNSHGIGSLFMNYVPILFIFFSFPYSDDSSDSELITSSQPQVDKNSCPLTKSLSTIKEKTEEFSEDSGNVKNENNSVEKTPEVVDTTNQEREMCSSPLFNDKTQVLDPGDYTSATNLKTEETYDHTKGSQKMEIDQTLIQQDNHDDSNDQEVDNINISLPDDINADQPKKPSPKFKKIIRKSKSPIPEDSEDEERLDDDDPIPRNKNAEDTHPVFRKDFDLENMKTSSQQSGSPDEDSAELLLSTQELMMGFEEGDEEEEIESVSQDKNVTNTANNEETYNCTKGSQKMEIDESLNENVQMSNKHVPSSSQSTSSMDIETTGSSSSNGNSIEKNAEATAEAPTIKRANTNDQIMNETEKVVSRIDDYETNSAETSFNLEADDAKPKVDKPEQHLNIINESNDTIVVHHDLPVMSEMNIANKSAIAENDVKKEEEKSEIEPSNIRRSNRARRPSAKVRSDDAEIETNKVKKPAKISTTKGRKSNVKKVETKNSTTETNIDNNEDADDAKPKVNKPEQHLNQGHLNINKSDENQPTIIVHHDDSMKSENIANENDTKKEEEKSGIEPSGIKRSNRAGRPSAKVRSEDAETDASKGKKPAKNSTTKGRKSNIKVETTTTKTDIDNDEETRRISKTKKETTNPRINSTTSRKSQDNTAQKDATEPDLVVINKEVENKIKSKIVTSEKSTASKNKGRAGKKSTKNLDMEAEGVESLENSKVHHQTNENDIQVSIIKTDTEEEVTEHYSQKRKTRNLNSREVIAEKKRKIKNEKIDLPIEEVIPGPSTSKETENSEVKAPNQNQNVQKSVSVKKETVEKARRGTKRPYSEPVTKKESAKASRSSTSTNSNENPKPSVRRTISTITGMYIALKRNFCTLHCLFRSGSCTKYVK